MAKHIALIGMMGVGKSTVAPKVAMGLNRRVIEVDQLIEKQEGMPIGEIFLAKGEAYFRRLEYTLISNLLDQAPSVLSLGGGAFIQENTRNLLLQKAVVFYLSATLETLCSRVEGGVSTRPLLNIPGVSFQDAMRDILERRNPYYSMAHYRIATDAHSPDDVSKSIFLMREAYE